MQWCISFITDSLILQFKSIGEQMKLNGFPRNVVFLDIICRFMPPKRYKLKGAEGMGVLEPLIWVFVVLQYFEKILPLVESP